jgi:hypothetical protein
MALFQFVGYERKQGENRYHAGGYECFYHFAAP